MPQKSKADHKRLMRVEVQFRTISMDWWASLEHKIRYKKGLQESDHVDQELFECAKMSAGLDSRMEKLQQFVGDLYEKAAGGINSEKDSTPHPDRDSRSCAAGTVAAASGKVAGPVYGSDHADHVCGGVLLCAVYNHKAGGKDL